MKRNNANNCLFRLFNISFWVWVVQTLSKAQKIYSVLNSLKFHWNECEYAFELSSFVKSLELHLKKPGWNTSSYFDEPSYSYNVQQQA